MPQRRLDVLGAKEVRVRVRVTEVRVRVGVRNLWRLDILGAKVWCRVRVRDRVRVRVRLGLGLGLGLPRCPRSESVASRAMG